MRLFICLCLLTGCAYSQVPARVIRRDSIPGISSADPMPNARPTNSFYRRPGDAPNVVRATLDNMPVKVPDTSMQYTILRMNEQPLKLGQQPKLYIPPLPPIKPKLP